MMSWTLWEGLSSSDLAAGIGINVETKAKSAFFMHHGLYQFIRMPLGMCNVLATLQQLMELVLAGLVWKSCIDGVLAHLSHLQEVLPDSAVLDSS